MSPTVLFIRRGRQPNAEWEAKCMKEFTKRFSFPSYVQYWGHGFGKPRTFRGRILKDEHSFLLMSREDLSDLQAVRRASDRLEHTGRGIDLSEWPSERTQRLQKVGDKFAVATL